MAERHLGQRSKKGAERWKKHFERQKELHRQIKAAAGEDILKSRNFRTTREHIQHGNMTVNNHCMNVARYSLAFSDKLHITCNRKELIIGALLHDYFLYDWHDEEHVKLYRFHGFRHPGVALKNASQDYRLTEREKDIIRKHMWPLTVVPPMCREAWIVSAADKWCSLMETFHMHRGHGALLQKLRTKREEEGDR